MVEMRRGVATSTHVWPAIPGLPRPPLRGLSSPALARTGGQPWMIQSGPPGRHLSLDEPVRGTAAPPACSAPDDPVWGVRSYFTGECSRRAKAFPSCLFPDDPVQGTSWPRLRFAALPRPHPGLRITASPQAPPLGCLTDSPRPRPLGCCSSSPRPRPPVYLTASPRPCPPHGCTASPRPRPNHRFFAVPRLCPHGRFSASPRPFS